MLSPKLAIFFKKKVPILVDFFGSNHLLKTDLFHPLILLVPFFRSKDLAGLLRLLTLCPG